MKLHNTLTRQTDEFVPHDQNLVTIYSCGPTVYDHIHIGNLSAFITADLLRRTLAASSYSVKHVMNFTDVDDKTIRRSNEKYPSTDPKEALHKLTREYEGIFMDDMNAIGNDTLAMQFIRATESVEGMRQLIKELYDEGFAYITDDGVYFSIEKYRGSGKKYGQLLELNEGNTSEARIDNDEYEKESVHDFALWKKQKTGEPAWEFELDGTALRGRPGWHIECSVMSVAQLGQPFDIHTGGIDLIFPHHENEIAQSTAGSSNEQYASVFVHNEHLLIEGKKMSKSLNNFYTLEDVRKKGYEPLGFRLMVMQSHYRKQANFTWENLEAAQNRLQGFREMADLRWQPSKEASTHSSFDSQANAVLEHMADDMNSSMALAVLSNVANDLKENITLHPDQVKEFIEFLNVMDNVFGLGLLDSHDVDAEAKTLIAGRQEAKDSGDWKTADQIRASLKERGIGLHDTKLGQIWFRD